MDKFRFCISKLLVLQQMTTSDFDDLSRSLAFMSLRVVLSKKEWDSWNLMFFLEEGT